MTALAQLPLLPKPRLLAERPLTNRLPAQGYRLTITPAGTQLEAADPAGEFYGRMTLRQLQRLCPTTLPCGVIEDWPDIPLRGVMLDISRDKVPTMATLFGLVDMLAEWKVNHLQLYMEHTFAYRNHREVWAAASPLTADEVRQLDAYCRERFIELSPNQNSFGHFERWLRHPRYRPLAECPAGFTASTGEWRDVPTTLDPTNPATLELLAELYAELLPNFTSRRLHIGGDETWELGKGYSQTTVERHGLATVYLDYLAKLKSLAGAQGCTVQYWGDMVWSRFPDQLGRLDREMMHVDWGYYRAYPFCEHAEKLAAHRIPFWLAPGTGVWGTLVGCNEAALGSNRSAATAARDCGAQGLLNTDWGDGGHWQHLPVSFIGLAAGAALAWHEAGNSDATIRAALDSHVFRDPTGILGRVAWALGDTWKLVSEHATQSNLLDHILRGKSLPAGVTSTTLSATAEHLRAALAELAKARPACAQLVDAFANNAQLALAACRLGQLILAGTSPADPHLAADFATIIAERRRLWLAQNRPGGLEDSLRPLEEQLQAMQKHDPHPLGTGD
ncbi:MAG: hypothetical protein PCFJNLEI_01387 [Verrucomicrobiae bacterium]|nr:hypothetical protein [Verrucomicrobiae bacterium]